MEAGKTIAVAGFQPSKVVSKVGSELSPELMLALWLFQLQQLRLQFPDLAAEVHQFFNISLALSSALFGEMKDLHLRSK